LQRYWKTENVASVLYEWGEHYSDLLPVWLTIYNCLKDFDGIGLVADAPKSDGPWTVTFEHLNMQ
jgi:hypothetical protein